LGNKAEEDNKKPSIEAIVTEPVKQLSIETIVALPVKQGKFILDITNVDNVQKVTGLNNNTPSSAKNLEENKSEKKPDLKVFSVIIPDSQQDSPNKSDTSRGTNETL